MSRRDGTFPAYEKIEIDPNVWPANYWTACLSCEQCDTNWPETSHFELCPECHVETEAHDFRPTYRWPDAVKRLHTARFEHLYDEWDEMPDITITEVKEPCLTPAEERP